MHIQCSPLLKIRVRSNSYFKLTSTLKQSIMSPSKVIQVEIVSDAICPWCFVGKRKVEQAITALKKQDASVDVQVHWRPFFLDPNLPTPGSNKLAMYEKKFGGKERVEKMVKHMKAVGGDNGIRFSYGGDVGNTLRAHRLIKYAGDKNSVFQNKVVEELFKSYFEEEKDISRIDVLVDSAVKAGLNKQEVIQYLNSDESAEDVKKEAVQAQMAGINSVPTFFVEGNRLPSSQGTDSLLSVFQNILKQ